MHPVHRATDLKGKHTVTERGGLLVLRQLVAVGNPASRQAHQPLHERRCRAGALGVVQECWRRSGSPGDVLPPGNGIGVASPAPNSPSIRDQSISDSALLFGEPAGP